MDADERFMIDAIKKRMSELKSGPVKESREIIGYSMVQSAFDYVEKRGGNYSELGQLSIKLASLRAKMGPVDRIATGCPCARCVFRREYVTVTGQMRHVHPSFSGFFYE